MASKSARLTILKIPDNLQKVAQKIHALPHDIFELERAAPDNSLELVVYEIFNNYGFMDIFSIDPVCMKKFINTIELGYRSQANLFKEPNPYHNNLHATDVTLTTYQMLKFSNLDEYFNDLERFSLIIAAIIHDYLHPGTANQFEAQFNTDIFAIYKQEEGLLERYSIDKTFELMKKDNCNIVKGLSKEKLNKFTDLVKTLVMATDMQSHFKHYNDLNRFITANLNNKSKPSKATTMCWLLHCADISNGAKEWNVYLEWAKRVMKEFYRKGDFEKAHNKAISFNCNREKDKIDIVQIGFLDKIVEPTFKLLSNLVERYNPEPGNKNFQADSNKNICKVWEENVKNNKEEWIRQSKNK